MHIEVSSGALSGNSDFAFSEQDLLKNFEINSNIPTVEVSFEKTTAVDAKTRRLAARWSVELDKRLCRPRRIISRRSIN